MFTARTFGSANVGQKRRSCRQIRALGLHTPILSLSADVFDDAQRATAGLFCRTMNKPFSRQQLLNCLAEIQTEYPPQQLTITAKAVPAPTVGTDDELLDEYRQSLPPLADQLEQLCEQADLTGLGRLLHQIKGTSACFGLTTISTLAQQANQDLRQLGAIPASIQPLLIALRSAQ